MAVEDAPPGGPDPPGGRPPPKPPFPGPPPCKPILLDDGSQVYPPGCGPGDLPPAAPGADGSRPKEPAALDLDVSEDLEWGEEPSDEEYEEWEEIIAGEGRGERVLFGITSGRPGKLIGFPYSSSHTLGNWQSDNAVDVWLYPGSRIVACANGRVSERFGYGLMATEGRFAGSRLHVEHPSGMVSFYHHMRSLEAEPGRRVQQGDLLGYSGIANDVPHLHFAVSPPFSPRAFYVRAFSLKGRQPFKPKVPPAPPTPGDLPVRAPRRPTMEQAWQELMTALGRQVPLATETVRAVRRELLRGMR